MAIFAHFPDSEEVGQILRSARTTTGLSRVRMAELFGQHQNSLARWEKGSGASGLKYAVAMARYDVNPRNVVIRHLGGGEPGPSTDPPELRSWLEAVRQAYNHGDPATRMLMETLKQMVRGSVPV